jgi:hypothetical protein
MAHKLFQPKPSVKFLITTEPCKNLTLIFQSYISLIDNSFVVFFEPDKDYYSATEIANKYFPHDPLRYADYNAEYLFPAVSADATPMEIKFTYHQCVQSICDRLDFHHPHLYWYLIS